MNGSSIRMRSRRTNGVEISEWPSSVKPCSGRTRVEAKVRQVFPHTLLFCWRTQLAYRDARQLVECQGVSALRLSFLPSEIILDRITVFDDRVQCMKLRGCNSVALFLPASAQVHYSAPNARTSKCEAILVIQSRSFLCLCIPLISTSPMVLVCM